MYFSTVTMYFSVVTMNISAVTTDFIYLNYNVCLPSLNLPFAQLKRFVYPA